MGVVKIHHKPDRAVGPLVSLSGSSSTGDGTQYVFDYPLTNFGFQVTGASTTLVVLLQGAIPSSSAASFTTLLTWAASSMTSGEAMWGSAKPVTQLKAVLNAGASSGGASAWIVGAP